VPREGEDLFAKFTLHSGGLPDSPIRQSCGPPLTDTPKWIFKLGEKNLPNKSQCAENLNLTL